MSRKSSIEVLANFLDDTDKRVVLQKEYDNFCEFLAATRPKLSPSAIETRAKAYLGEYIKLLKEIP